MIGHKCRRGTARAAQQVGTELSAAAPLLARVSRQRPAQLPVERYPVQVVATLDQIGEDLGPSRHPQLIAGHGDHRSGQRHPPSPRERRGEQQPPQAAADRGVQRCPRRGELSPGLVRQQQPKMRPRGHYVEPVFPSRPGLRGAQCVPHPRGHQPVWARDSPPGPVQPDEFLALLPRGWLTCPRDDQGRQFLLALGGSIGLLSNPIHQRFPEGPHKPGPVPLDRS